MSVEFGDAVDVVLIDQSDGFIFGFSKLDNPPSGMPPPGSDRTRRQAPVNCAEPHSPVPAVRIQFVHPPQTGANKDQCDGELNQFNQLNRKWRSGVFGWMWLIPD